MAAHNKVVVVVLVGILLTACVGRSVNVKEEMVPNTTACRPNSLNNAEVAKSQMACHQGVAGDGVHVLVSDTFRRANLRSDSTERELVSIFIRPAGATRRRGPVTFEAFYSKGLFDLTGKTGCVGVFKDGTAVIEKSAKKSILNYSLRFDLVSPLGWPEDCKELREIAGEVEL